MSDYPATTVRVTGVEPCGDGKKVCIRMEMIADVNRLSDVASQLLSATVDQLKTQATSRKKK
jgi:hypothetical protein